MACPVVWAELRAAFADSAALRRALNQAEIGFDPFDQAVAEKAGEIWRHYRAQGGTRAHLVPDFLVGAHAQIRAQCLLSRDRGFYRGYFRGLEVISPVG